MSYRDMQTRLNSTWKSGKDGFIAAITESSENYSGDSTLSPSEWGDLSAKQAVANYGGYFVAHKGMTAEYVYGFANAISKKYNALDKQLTDSATDIKSLLVRLDAELTAENEFNANKALALGDTGEKLVKGINSSVDDLASAMTVTVTPRMVSGIRDAIARLEALITDDGSSVVPVNQEKVLVS